MSYYLWTWPQIIKVSGPHVQTFCIKKDSHVDHI